MRHTKDEIHTLAYLTVMSSDRLPSVRADVIRLDKDGADVCCASLLQSRIHCLCKQSVSDTRVGKTKYTLQSASPRAFVCSYTSSLSSSVPLLKDSVFISSGSVFSFSSSLAVF